MAAATITLAACTDEDDNIASQSTPLQVQTTLNQARSVITDTAFGDGQSIGITLVDNTDGATAYEGKTEGYTNIPYTSSGTGESQTWGAQNPIMLSPTVGKAVAYYPYAQANADYKAIPVTAQGQTDYMYSGWTDADGISNADAKATFVMQHALSAIRITVKKGNYSQTGSLSAISLTSDGFGVSGTLNAATGALAGVAAAEVNSTMNPDFATANITAEGLSNILMVVPTGVAEAKPMTVTVTIDGKQYAAQANMTEPVAQGKIYSVALLLDNKTFEVTEVDITPWNEKQPVEGGALDAYDPYSSMTAIFEVDDVSTPTRLLGEDFSIAQMHSMVIDGQEVQPTRTYTFPEPGNYTVRYQFEPGKLTSARFMFKQCTDLININVYKCKNEIITDMASMFNRCVKLKTVDLSPLNTAEVTKMNSMFEGCQSLDWLDLTYFETSKVTNMAWMFKECKNLTQLNLAGWDTSNVTDMNNMFKDANNLTKLNVTGWNTENVTNMWAMFYKCKKITFLDLSHFNTSKVTRMDSMFEECGKLSKLNLSGWNTSNVGDIAFMFRWCNVLYELDLSHFDVSNVTNMWGCFWGTGGQKMKKLNLSGWNTSKVTNMAGMFYSFNFIDDNGQNKILDLSHFNTSKVTTMAEMFYMGPTKINLTGWDTSNVTNMQGMFRNLIHPETSFDVSHFKTSKVTNMAYMFDNVRHKTDFNLSGWDLSACTNMKCMFGFTNYDGMWDTKTVRMMGDVNPNVDVTNMFAIQQTNGSIIYTNIILYYNANKQSAYQPIIDQAVLGGGTATPVNP